MATLASVGVWGGAIGFGVMAGVYFAFSAFVMKALATIPRSAGISAMQSINEVILSSAFMPLFFGTSLIGAAIAGWSLTEWGQPAAWALLAGGVVYVVGMLLCTVVGNVPLNDALAAIDPSSAEGAPVWSDYLRRWTLLNHVRTVASTLACGLFVFALAAKA